MKMKKRNKVVLDLKDKENKRSPVSVVCSALGTALLIILILICIPLTLPGIFHYQPYAVISASMEPAIPVGSLVYIKSIDPQEAEVDDVVAYYGGRDANVIVTHRVVENRVVMGEIITKGDANQTADMNPVSYDEFIGRVEISIPEMGVIAQILTSNQGKILAGCLIGVALLLHLVSSVIEKTRKSEN